MKGDPDTAVEFDAPEYRDDATFRVARLRIAGSTARGFRVSRDGVPWLDCGPGYRLLRTVACGVCSTDLDRHHLPFRLPQVIGHELVALDAAGRRHVVEINASPQARGRAADCPDCRDGLARHCPKRLVLGIHDLPGGFGPWILAPVHAVVPIPDTVPTDAALLVEPFAAALRAVERIAPSEGDRVAVLGPRKLGMLVIAALAAHRRRTGIGIRIEAIVRRAELARVARLVGSDRVHVVAGDDRSLPDGWADVVVDTTGSPGGFELALRVAGREVHLKSTHGRAAGGLERTTAMVVDELALERYGVDALERARRRDGRIDVAWMSAAERPPPLGDARVEVGDDARRLRDAFPARAGGCIVGADVAVVDDLAAVDRVIRPDAGDEQSLLRPCGRILLTRAAGGAVAEAVVRRGVTLTTSRCGDFRAAIELLEGDAPLRDALGGLITHRFGVARIAEAFDVARSAACIKAVVEQPDSAGPGVSDA